MHVAHIISGIDISAGEPSRKVKQLCANLADQRIDTYLISKRLRNSRILLPVSPMVSNPIGFAGNNLNIYAGIAGWRDVRKRRIHIPELWPNKERSAITTPFHRLTATIEPVGFDVRPPQKHKY
jgi:hypothetical protein